MEKLGRDDLCPHGKQTSKTAAGWYMLSLQELWEAALPRW
jgi:hypothetical protein